MKQLYTLLLVILFPQVLTAMSYVKTIKIGETYHCSASGSIMSGYILDNAYWSVSGSGIRQYGASTKLGCTIEGVKVGYGYVSCELVYRNFKNGNTISEYYNWDITVIDNKPTSISIKPASSSLIVGESTSLTPVFYPSGTQSSVTWSTNNSSVATVNSNGRVDAVGPGTASISVQTENGLMGSTTITVYQQATGISLPQTTTLDYHSYKSLSPTLSPEGSKVKSMYWQSSNESIVTVSSDGTLYGVEPGSATVSITSSNGLYAATTVMVKQPPFIVTCPSNGTTGVSVVNQGSIYAEVSPSIIKGSNFSNIRFENSDGSKVDGEPRINGSQVTYVPKKALKPFTSYAFVIPSGSLRNQWGGENTENYRFTFTTGDLESLQLECFHNRDYIEQGQSIMLYASNSKALIYYTLDGSEPTENSILLSKPICITEDLQIRAIAVLDGYQQATFSKSIKVSHVSVLEVYPDDTDKLYNYSNVIPSVTFTHNGLKSNSIGDIFITKDYNEISAQAYICDNRIYIVPKEPLTSGQYDIFIPDDFAKAPNGEPTNAVLWSFTLGDYVDSISAGYEHSMALKANGELLIWGRITRSDYTTPNSTEYVEWNPVVSDNWWPVKAISAGLTHSIFLDTDDNVYTWGLQHCGEIGKPSYTPYNYTKLGKIGTSGIVAGAQISALIADNGDLTLIGRNDFGQQGNNSTIPVTDISNIKQLDIKQVALGYGVTFALNKSGSLYGWGHNNLKQLSSVIKTNLFDATYLMNNVDYVAASRWDDCTAAVIKKDKSLWMWGSGTHGRLGGKDYLPIDQAEKLMDDVISVNVGTHVVAAIKSDKSLWMWGDGSYGELGNGSQDVVLRPQKVMDDVKQVDIGGNNVIVLKMDGSVWTWGTGKYGELGWGDNTPDSFTGLTPYQIISGRSRSDLQSLKLDFKEIKMFVGEEFLVGARPVPIDADYNSWQWTISNPNIGSVSEQGIVKAKQNGTATLKLTSDNGITATLLLNVGGGMLYGDANGDGEINMDDARSVANYILGNSDETFNAEAADANQDGKISIQDAMFIVNHILYGKFPDEK